MTENDGTPGAGKHHAEGVSQVLSRLAGDESRDRISIRDLLDALGDRAYGALMLVLALPNLVPTPPGTSAILGTPLVILSARLALGLNPWLPAFITRRSLARADFAAITARLAPWLARAERLMKPRLDMLSSRPAEHVIGLVCLVLAVILALPIPLGNILPALAICLFCFGLLERDGIFVLAGFALSCLASIVVGGVLYAFVKALILAASSAFL